MYATHYTSKRTSFLLFQEEQLISKGLWNTSGRSSHRRNYVFLRRPVGTHSRRFISPQAHGFTHRCCKRQPLHSLVVKMMKLKFFSSPGIRKLCSSGGAVRWDEVSFYRFSSFLFSYEPHSLQKPLICKNVFHKYSGLLILENCNIEIPGSFNCGDCSAFSVKPTSSRSREFSKHAGMFDIPGKKWNIVPYNDGNHYLAEFTHCDDH